MKFIAVALLALIAAILLFGADSVRSAPERVFPSGPHESHTYRCGRNGTLMFLADSVVPETCPLPREQL